MAIESVANLKMKITDFLKTGQGESYHSKDITAALKIHKSTYKLFKKALRELLEEGVVTRNRHGIISLAAVKNNMTGQIAITKGGSGFVSVEGSKTDIFIPPSMLKTALDKDIVEIELNARQRGKSLEGRVVSVISRKRTRFAGIFHQSKYYSFVVIDDPKVYRDFYIPKGMEGGARDGQMVAVDLISWTESSLNPEGKIVEILGFPDEKGVDVSAVMVNNGLALSFPLRVNEEANTIPDEIPLSELSSRMDLRSEFIFTIDPQDAKDFDDAVSLEIVDNGNLLMGVHIADVSYYVKEKSAIDEEAFERGTSIYMVDRVVPMLPEHLSNQLCSLRPDEDKLTMSCFIELSRDLKVVDYKIAPSMIRSKRRLNYEEAQQLIESSSDGDKFASKLKEMNLLAQRLKQQRLAKGGLDFFTPEVKFRMDEKGFPVEIIKVVIQESNQLIEEFMLMANKVIAFHLARKGKEEYDLPSVYRIHELPDEEKFGKFVNTLNVLGYKFNRPSEISPYFYQDVLNTVKGTKDEVLVDKIALRSMMKARYSTENEGHFGLGFDYYTHFTSPIRRYPDLLVHRLIKEYENSPSPARIKNLESFLKKAAEQSSAQERIAMEAERESVKIKQAEWISRHIGEEFNGMISGVASYGIYVEIDDILIEGLAHINQMTDDIYIYDEERYCLIGRQTGKMFRLGNPARVEVLKVNTDRHEIDFRLIDSMDASGKEFIDEDGVPEDQDDRFSTIHVDSRRSPDRESSVRRKKRRRSKSTAKWNKKE